MLRSACFDAARSIIAPLLYVHVAGAKRKPLRQRLISPVYASSAGFAACPRRRYVDFVLRHEFSSPAATSPPSRRMNVFFMLKAEGGSALSPPETTASNAPRSGATPSP